MGCSEPSLTGGKGLLLFHMGRRHTKEPVSALGHKG